VVRAAQHRTTAAELGILPSDNLTDLASVPSRIAFLNQLANEVRLTLKRRLPACEPEHITWKLWLDMVCNGLCAADEQVRAANVTRLAVVTTWGGGMAGVRRDLLPWMQIMTELGVSSFYVSLGS
jgi:hypothetical protein